MGRDVRLTMKTMLEWMRSTKIGELGAEMDMTGCTLNSINKCIIVMRGQM